MGYENTPEDLRKAYESFNVKHEFKPGMIVRWKEGLRSHTDTGPFVVMAVGDNDSEFKREDLIVGYIDKDGDLMRVTCDSRRFEPMPGTMSA